MLEELFEFFTESEDEGLASAMEEFDDVRKKSFTWRESSFVRGRTLIGILLS